MVNPTVLVFRTDRTVAGVVLELVQEGQRALEAQLLPKPPGNGDLHGLSGTGMRAAGIGPISRPQELLRAAFLQQQFVAFVEHENGKRAMEYAATLMTLALVEIADLPIQLVHQDEFLVRTGDVFPMCHSAVLPN